MGQGNTKSGVIGWGANDMHQLAFHSSSPGNPPSGNRKSYPPRIIETLSLNVISVSARGNYSVALMESGELFSWGKGEGGQLGLGNGEISSPIPRPIRGPLLGKIVRQISCGESHCAAITDTQALYTWGRGQHGRLGHGVTENEFFPRLVEAFVGIPVTAVACGDYHTVCATTNGLYSFGLGLSGRLGNGSEEDQYSPVQIGGPLASKQILKIAAGGHHSAAIVQPGVLYTWGGGAFGKLGHGSDTSSCLVPKLVTSLSHVRVAQVALGQQHSAALTVGGEIYIWGKSQGDRCEDIHTPLKVENQLPTATTIVCGKNQVYVVSNMGDIFVRGPPSPETLSTTNGFDQKVNEINRQQIFVLHGKGVIDIAVGDQHCIAMADPSRTAAGTAQVPLDPAELTSPVSKTSPPRPSPPSLVHVLESLIRAVPPPPPKPSSETEIVFLSEELKFAQKQNQLLARKLEETLARISHLERENVALREELDTSMQCLPLGTSTPPIVDQSTSPCFKENAVVQPILLT